MKQFTTLTLPYAYDALEPYIDKETMTLHHDKHHVTYTTKLNEALAKHPEMEVETVESLLMGLDLVPEDIRPAVRNHGGGHVNHAMFWEIMGPDAGGKPSGELLKAIESVFGSYESFVEKFNDAAMTQFGSGWAWLSVDGGKLIVEKTPNQDTPISMGRTPILCLDVWEHAYYLKYRNVRPDYIKAWWNVVNWKNVEQKFKKAI
ncbi:MAG: superoxide dismutase [Candidatus Kerfeldbacteria bacterium RIFCSPLOWO2_01_FULL_48_11]|uniref:Superoxide dismutase n=1 Tax=Candidatus Kerfeldbacteria bacterium RIFCSPLOWO2_01_FULL_48_11 TaxID=1798543 RepID=A0A1G2B2U8_9BACT|nr:MAG: superoxide dismutase [Candidatus Kerfeldbacteria bacterium RIFCSPLOWO2_01_FULL_48_11]